MNVVFTARGARRLLALLLAAACCWLMAGCASPQPADYARQTPQLDLRQYFRGKLLAHGLVTDRSGAVLEPWLTDQWYVKIAPLAAPVVDPAVADTVGVEQHEEHVEQRPGPLAFTACAADLPRLHRLVAAHQSHPAHDAPGQAGPALSAIDSTSRAMTIVSLPPVRAMSTKARCCSASGMRP